MTARRTRRIRREYNRIRRAYRVRGRPASEQIQWRDRQLRPITSDGGKLLLRLIRARRIAVTPLPGGGHVSTVATVIDQGLGGAPLCFETMVRGTGGTFDGVRSITDTEFSALRAHADIAAVLLAERGATG